VVEILGLLYDGPGGTGNDAGAAAPAAEGKRRGDFERHVGQDSDQAESGPVFGVNEKVVPADPAQSRKPADRFMGDLAALAFPIDDLGGRDRERSMAQVLNEGGEQERPPVQEGVQLPVMMKIERGGGVPDILENGVEKAAAQRNPEGEGIAEIVSKLEIRPGFADIGDPAQGKTDLQGFFLDPP